MLNNFLKYPAILICCFILSICTVSQADQRVSAIQNMLKNQGYDVGAIDGKAGKNTFREIKNWQFLNGYSESGKIDENQINTLRQQSSEGKKLNNNEMKIVKERNQSIKEKNKKKEKGSIKTTVLWWGAGLAYLLAIIGYLIGKVATPKKDRRYRTGYENNATVDEELKSIADVTIGCGSIIFCVVIIVAFKSYFL